MAAIERLHVGERMSQIVIHGDTVYLAGVVASDLSQDVVGQTTQVLATIDSLLADAGTDKTKILQATIWLADMATFSQMNSVWDPWVPAGATPVRACVGAPLATAEYLVEFRVIAGR